MALRPLMMCREPQNDYYSSKCSQKGLSVMGKSLSGPDAIDVMAMMMAMGTLHSGHVEVRLVLRGTGLTPSVMVQCLMCFDVLPGSALPPQVVSEAPWPCGEHKELLSHIYAGLHRLDYEVSQVYKNEALWADG